MRRRFGLAAETLDGSLFAWTGSMRRCRGACMIGGTVNRCGRQSRLFLVLMVLALGLLWRPCPARADTLVRDAEEEKTTGSRLVLPYVFGNDANGLFAGLAAGMANRGGAPTVLGATAAASTKDAELLALWAKDVRMPGMDRMFLEFLLVGSRYHDLRAYVNGNPEFPGQDAGSNESDEDNFLEGTGWDTSARVSLKYVLPIGHGLEGAVNTYTLSRGLLSSGASGGERWNPFRSGRTFLELQSFYRVVEFEEQGEDLAFKTNGLRFRTTYDNRDFPLNPERGSRLNARISRDFGRHGSSDSWTVVRGDYSKYLSLGATDWARQQVLAFNAWTAETPSWKETVTAAGTRVDHRPPYFEGATLGGFDRLRAFPFYRFNDRAAMYYNAEYRVIPAGKPFLGGTRLMKKYKLAWWQVVGFVEAGRVAESWRFRELHTHMKWDAGVGLRAMLSKTIVRLDIAVAARSFGGWVMVGQAANF